MYPEAMKMDPDNVIQLLIHKYFECDMPKNQDSKHQWLFLKLTARMGAYGYDRVGCCCTQKNNDNFAYYQSFDKPTILMLYCIYTNPNPTLTPS